MDNNKEEVIIDVKINVDEISGKLVDVNKNIANLKQQRKDLVQAEREGVMSSKDVAAALELNSKATKEYKATLKAMQGQIQMSAKDNNIMGDSIHEMRARLSQLKNEYASLSKVERDSAAGNALRDKVKSLNDEVKAAEQSFGDFQRNVGNYQSALNGFNLDNIGEVLGNIGGKVGELGGKFTSGFSSMLTSAKTLGKAMITPPIGLIVAALSAIMVAVQKVSQAFQKNDTAGTQMASLYASFQPIFTAVSKAADAVAGAIGRAAEALAKFIGRNSEAAKAAQDLVIAEDNLQQAERDYTVNFAKNDAQISELKLKAKDRDKYTAAERKKFLEEATLLQEQNLKAEKDIAAERLRILKEKARQEADTSDETTNAIANAEAELYRAQKKYNDGQRELAEQKVALNSQIKAEEKALTDAKRAQLEERERMERETAARIEKINEDLRKAIIDNIEDEKERNIAAVKEKYTSEIDELKAAVTATIEERDALNALILEKTKARDREIADIEAQDAEERLNAEYEREMRRIDRMLSAAQEGSIQEEELRLLAVERMRERELQNAELTEQERAAIIIKYQNQTANIIAEGQEQRQAEAAAELKKLADEQAQLVQGTLSMSSAVFGGLSDIIGEFAGENEQLARFQKAMALFQIGIDTASAISRGVASAQAVPFPANLAAIATTIAAVTANIVKATQMVKKSKEPKFASGGIVGGTSFSGDKITAKVNSGEMILTLDQQRRLFQIADGKRQGQTLDVAAFAEATARAVSKLPPPILEYREFLQFQKDTNRLNKMTIV